MKKISRPGLKKISRPGLKKISRPLLNRKALMVAPHTIVKIVGGVIVLGILMLIIAPFAGSYLDFLSISENIEAFNKFTNAYSRACTTGSAKAGNIILTDAGNNMALFHIMTFESRIVDSISNLPECGQRDEGECDLCYENSPCKSKRTDGSLAECKGESCVCLVEVDYWAKNSDESVSLTGSEPIFNTYEVAEDLSCPSHGNAVQFFVEDSWYKTYFKDVKQDKEIARLNVVQCKSLKDMGCYSKEDGYVYLYNQITEIEDGHTTDGWLVSIHPLVIKEDKGTDAGTITSYNLNIDSIIFERPIEIYDDGEGGYTQEYADRVYFVEETIVPSELIKFLDKRYTKEEYTEFLYGPLVESCSV